jgi:eukaryotic-like serine/threonine-protein kinase
MMGKTISHYKILEKLGEGGMGVVYKAEDLKLKRMVAIKFLPRSLSIHGEERERFTMEAQAASALNHPNVAVIYEIDESEGETFIVMEYVDGKTLREAKQGLSIRQVADIGIQIAEGLAAAHEKGIVHRDVKAENIMLRKDGRVQVMDFGLAKLRGVSKLTKMGSTIGTIGYMSPEQAQGVETDQRTDIFSFGVLLFELLTGQMPFNGSHEAAVMYEIINVDPPAISDLRHDVEPELERIIMKCLEKDREERYHSVKDVSVDLKHFKRDSEGRRVERKTPSPGTSQISVPVYTTPQTPSGIGSRRWLLIAVVVLVLGVGGFILWQVLKPSSQISPNMVFKPLQLPFTTVWYPGLSSDGNWVAFPATDAHNVTEIYYMHVSGGELKKLTNDSLWKFSVDISPDGSQIVYARSRSRRPFSFPLELFTISTFGGTSRKIADAGIAPRWSPDGTSIAYLSRGITLWLMNADGSNKRLVIKDSSGGGRVSVGWSPDGKSLAWLRTFTGATGSYQEIIIHNLETGKERQVTHEKKNIDEVYWMPQGEILYSSNREGSSNLWAVPFEGGTPVQITKGPGPDLAIKASKDGKRVLYMQQASFGAVMVGGADGQNATAITPDDQSVLDPTFSPDGKQIAFLVADPDPIKPFSYLYLVDPAGRNRHQLTTAGENIENFVWSPDGRKIAYVVHVNLEVDSAHRTEIIDISDPTQKTIVGNGRVIQWLKDGSSLNIFSGQTSWRVPVEGGSHERMVDDSTFVLQSPDGQKLAFLDNHVGKAGLSVKLTDKPAKSLIQDRLDRRGVRWLPDSKNIVYMKSGEMWMVSIETGKTKRYPWKSTDALSFSDVSPDGKHSLFVKERMNAKLILIDNFH